ncbi:sulfatase, partial [Salmonella enterica subsp. enterica serovar Anatum]|nr:sulfatase [Salmonella enterica subsp. enterica serovar Anatum]
RYDVDELGKLSLAPPFNFTKGLQVLRIPAREKYKGVNSFGHLLLVQLSRQWLEPAPQYVQLLPELDRAMLLRRFSLLLFAGLAL